MAQGTQVAVLGPLASLPKGAAIKETITTNDIARGRRNFSSAIHNAPYLVVRSGQKVAVIFAPKKNELTRIDEVLEELDSLRILDEARERRLALRVAADKRIEVRIAVLRQNGEIHAAEQLAADFSNVDRSLDRLPPTGGQDRRCAIVRSGVNRAAVSQAKLVRLGW